MFNHWLVFKLTHTSSLLDVNLSLESMGVKLGLQFRGLVCLGDQNILFLRK